MGAAGEIEFAEFSVASLPPGALVQRALVPSLWADFRCNGTGRASRGMPARLGSGLDNGLARSPRALDLARPRRASAAPGLACLATASSLLFTARTLLGIGSCLLCQLPVGLGPGYQLLRVERPIGA